MQSRSATMGVRRWQIAGGMLAAAVLIWGRRWLWQAAVQLFLGMLVALLALPLTRRFEKRLSPGLSASMALMALGVGMIAFFFLLLPPLIRQGKELAAMLPSLLERLNGLAAQGRAWLERNGLPTDGAWLMPDTLGAAAPKVVGWMGGMAGSIGQWMLAPVFAFYFLRDRKRIAQWLMMLLPAEKRGLTVRILREMRRETAGYLRGQLTVSAIVGGLTAVGLLFCGLPSWLALGALMGILEWLPYVGPFAGGVLVALFALPLGWTRVLWALGVVLAVQQAEGSVLSPQLISDATRLHPVVVILCVTVGGAAAGMAGILLSAPLLLCLRATLRVVAAEGVHKC